MPTIFTKIIQRQVSADILYQDDQVTAFRNSEPKARIHILIVPNKEIPTVNDIAPEDEQLIGHMFTAARKVAAQEGVAAEGYRLLINVNDVAGQEIYHLHMHLLAGQPLPPTHA